MLLLPLALLAMAGCHTGLANSWLEPSAVGNYVDERTTDIRTTLSIQDSPGGIPGATDPIPEDLIPDSSEYRFGAGDSLTVRIFELMAEDVETQTQSVVSNSGNIRLPLLGTVQVAGLTERELEDEIIDMLDQKEFIRDAQVMVESLVRRKATFSLFGATSGANLYPLPSPDFSLMEALSIAGGLDELVTEIYIFREESEPLDQIAAEPSATQPAAWTGFVPDGPDQERLEQPEPEPIYLSVLSGGTASAGSRASTAGGLTDPPDDADLAPVDGEPQVALEPDGELLEVIESVAGPQSQPAQTQPSATQPTDAQPPAAQSRWIFLNGSWIETKPVASQPSGSEVDVVDEHRPPAEGGAPLPEPMIDWSQMAGKVTRQRIIRVSPEGLRTGDVRQNILLRPGDTIRVLAGEVGEYYMMGQINRPGAYSLTGRQVTLKSAVAAAGNLSALAWPERCTLYRRLGDREEMIQVNVNRVFAGQDPDFYLKKNDLIVFGTHPVSIFLAVIRSAFRMSYGFGFVWDRNFADVDSQARSIRVPQRALREAQASNRFPGLFP